MTSYAVRFDAVYDYVSGFAEPIDLTPALGFNDFDDIDIVHSIAAGEGIHIDDSKRPTSRAIGFICITNSQNAKLKTRIHTIDRVELYRDDDGEVIPNFTGRANVYQEFAPGLNHGYPERDLEVPPQSRELAINSALVAVEQAAEAHQALTIS
jgi:hypothetical protein